MKKQGSPEPIAELDPNMRLTETDASGLRLFSPMEPPFQIAGFAWFGEERRYRRLPLQPRLPIPAPVDALANHTAGGQIRFRTNSRKLSIRVKLQAISAMDHMPATGQCGFDCYLDEDGKPMFHGTARYDQKQKEYESVLFELAERKPRNVTLYFPLYQGVEEVALLLEADVAVEAPAPFAGRGKVVVYGSSITQGGCAARPGMAYPSIIGRRLPYEFINLGFSGNGRGEPEMAELIADIPDPACLVLDYEANCPSVEHVQRTLPAFIDIYRERHPHVPILVVSKIRYAKELFNEQMLATRLEMKRVEQETVERRRGMGDRNIHFFDGSVLLDANFEECTVDGVHPTDLGFMRMADGLTPVLSNLLQNGV